MKDLQLSFSHLPFNLPEFHHSGRNNILYGLEVGGKNLVLKEIRPESEYWQLGKDAKEVCTQLTEVFKIAKKHYGNQLEDTTYLVMRNKAGIPTVISIQEEVIGSSLLDEVKAGDGHDAMRCQQVVEEFDRKWDEVMRDPDWDQLPKKTYEFFSRNMMFQDTDIELAQIIHTPDDRYVLIDF